MSVTPQTNTTIEEIAEHLRTLDSFALCGHVSPDGDCIGSALGLSHALRMLGKKTTCLLAADASIEPGLRFLPGADELIYAGDYDETPDAFIALDVPTIERIKDAAVVHDRAGVRITIDHHAVDTTMAELSYTDPDAPACGMLVWDLIRAFGIEPPRESAICCYTALMTDTGRFQYQNTSAEAFRYAMEMVRCGANPADASQNVYQSRSEASFALEAVMLSRLFKDPAGRWAISFVTRDDMERTGAVKSDTETLIDTVRSMAGIQVACILREQEGEVRGSLRAKGDDVDVSVLARRIGGGGHKAAAGFTYKGTLDGALKDVPRLIDRLFDEGGLD